MILLSIVTVIIQIHMYLGTGVGKISFQLILKVDFENKLFLLVKNCVFLDL